jgi:NAD(P)H-hydrate epimerase
VRPVITPAEAAELDRATQERGVGVETLMARAGFAVARAVLDQTGGAYGRRAVVLRGKGHNGGDGAIAAGHLRRWGMRVAVLPVPASAADVIARELGRADVAIDAMVGTGFRGALDGALADAAGALDDAGCPVVAVDIPSGVDGATGAVPGPAVHARLTVTFGAPKVGSVLMPGAELVGDLRVADIGFPEDLVPATTGLTEPADVDAAITGRATDTHKKATGVVLVVAGSRAMTGAARLVAGAAMRAGAGYVIVAAPATALPAILGSVPEAVGMPLDETDEGTIGARALEAVLERAAAADAVAVGPGLTTHPETVSFVRQLVRGCPVPTVIDGDGLNAFEGDVAALADRAADAVLTPHLGELARLGVAGLDRLAAARELAAVAGAVALAKGTRSAIAEPGGLARINPTGTPALATAGTGDVLTGAIAGLLARGLPAFDAAWAGAYLHGLAGVLAAGALGEGIVAGDVLGRLPAALDAVREQAA